MPVEIGGEKPIDTGTRQNRTTPRLKNQPTAFPKGFCRRGTGQNMKVLGESGIKSNTFGRTCRLLVFVVENLSYVDSNNMK